MQYWFLSHERPANAQVRLRIWAVSHEHSLMQCIEVVDVSNQNL